MPKINSYKRFKNCAVKVDLDFPTEKILNTATVNTIGQSLLNQVLGFMGRGISPVTGRKFTPYINPKNYPEKVRKEYPNKRNSPVNLKLSGKLWQSFKWRKSGNQSFAFGVDSDLPYVETHNEGTHPHVPQRKFLPTSKGEEFNKTIMLELRRKIVDRIKALLKNR